MARSFVNIVTQLGIETTPGTPVPANKKLPTLSVLFVPETETKFTRAFGFKYPTQGALHREWAGGTYNGPLSYNEIVYILSGLIGSPNPTVVGTTGYLWTFSPLSSGADSWKTFTLQRGDAALAMQAAYATFTTMSVAITRQDCTVSGALIGQKISNNITLTVTPTLIAQQPVSENEVDIFLDSTFGSIGTTKWTDPYETTITFPAFFNPKWVLNTAFPAWKELVEMPRDITISVKAEMNAQTSGFFDTLKVDALPVQYMRIKALGAAIPGGTAFNTLAWDFAVKLDKITDAADHDGVYAYQLDFHVIHDPTMGKPFSLAVTNALTAL